MNDKRKLHLSPPLKWNYVYEAEAQACANDIASTGSNQRCNNNNFYGTIHFTLTSLNQLSNEMLFQNVIDHIYQGARTYSYGTQSATAFSQLIWSGSTEVGVGIARTENNGNSIYRIAIFFFKMGNYGSLNDFIKNVKPSAATPEEQVDTTKKPVDTTEEPVVATEKPVATTQEPSGLNAIQAVCLSEHNKRRALHRDTNPLVYDVTAEQSAQQWANHLASTLTFKHETQRVYGENLYRSQRTGTAVKDENAIEAALNGWYDREINLYNYNNPGFSSKTGHFTQVIWKGTTHVGCAIARIESNGFKYTYVVSRYSPPGNFGNRFKANVEPLLN